MSINSTMTIMTDTRQWASKVEEKTMGQPLPEKGKGSMEHTPRDGKCKLTSDMYWFWGVVSWLGPCTNWTLILLRSLGFFQLLLFRRRTSLFMIYGILPPPIHSTELFWVSIRSQWSGIKTQMLKNTQSWPLRSSQWKEVQKNITSCDVPVCA